MKVTIIGQRQAKTTRRRFTLTALGASLSGLIPPGTLFAQSQDRSAPQNSLTLVVPPRPQDMSITPLSLIVDGPRLRAVSVDRIEIWMEGLRSYQGQPETAPIADIRYPAGQGRVYLSTRFRLSLTNCDLYEDRTIFARASFSDGGTETVSVTSRPMVANDTGEPMCRR